MKALILILLVATLCISVNAHPGIGLVYDGESTIYYTDLSQIWKLDLNTKEKSVFVPNVHSHELHLDTAGNLYGEHYSYQEETQTFKNYIWRQSAWGDFEVIRPEQQGENTDFSFIRDEAFNAYSIKKDNSTWQIIREGQGGDTILATGDFKDIRWKYLDKNNMLYVVDYHSLYRLSMDREPELLASDLKETRFPFSFNNEQHNVYGIWKDENENVYCAIFGGRVVKRIAPDGKIDNLLRTGFFWSPVNGLFDKDNNLWLMESSLLGKVRVRKVEQQDLHYSSFYDIIELTFLLILVLFLGRFALKTVNKRVKRTEKIKGI